MVNAMKKLAALAAALVLPFAAQAAPPQPAYVAQPVTAGAPAKASGPQTLTTGIFTTPLASVAHAGRYNVLMCSTPNSSGNLSRSCIEDESVITAVDSSSVYSSSDFSPTYSGSGGSVSIVGLGGNPTWSGHATASAGNILYGGNFVAHFTGSGTLDNMFGAVTGASSEAATVTSATGVYGFTQENGGAITNATAFNAQNVFLSGTPPTTYVSFLDNSNVGTAPGTVYGFLSLDTTHIYYTAGAFEFFGITKHDYLTASALVATDSSKQLASVTIGSGLSYSGGVLSASGGSGTVTNFSCANTDCTVTNPTTTPQLTIVSAPKLDTPRSISISGDGTWTVNFDGSTNVTAAFTLASVGSAGSCTLCDVTFDAKGRETARASGIASDIGALIANTGASHKFFSAFSASGVFTLTQPDFSDLTGSVACAQMPALLGDVTSSAGSCTTAVKSNLNLPGSPTTTTQAPSDNTTKIATTAYVTTAIAGIGGGGVTTFISATTASVAMASFGGI